ncbi:MAG: DNA recombination protein RmuC, partial [Mesorhizobium sp.]|nr:DNA recombination protein RmuC [Mesorhizobium sp.]
KDIDDILVSSSKVTKRGQKIEALEFGTAAEDADEETRQPAAAGKRVADSKTGQLRLRVVEGDE